MTTKEAETDGVTIYLSDPDAAVERLAQLDSVSSPKGQVLVAAVGGEPRAALPLDGGPAIADPFKPTAELLSLLELRAAQLTHRSSSGVLAELLGLRRSPVEPVGRLA